MRPIDLGLRPRVPAAFLRGRLGPGETRPAIGEERSVDSHHSLRLRLGVAKLTPAKSGLASDAAEWSEQSFLGFAQSDREAPGPGRLFPQLGGTFGELIDRVEIQVYPIGVAVAVAYFSWSEAVDAPEIDAGTFSSLRDALEGVDGEDALREVPAVIDKAFGHCGKVQEELERAMNSSSLLAASLSAIASSEQVEPSDVLQADCDQSSPWLHRLWWEEGDGREECFLAGSGSSVLYANRARPERSRSCVDILAFGTALWLHDDIVDTECVRKISWVDSSVRLEPEEIKREQRWLWETAIVPTVARSVLTSLPTFALHCWQQLDRVWEFETVDRNLNAKIDVLRAMLIDREARNRRRRESWAVAALAVLGAASLASAATDIVGQLTSHPVAENGVASSRLIVLVVIGSVSVAAALLLLRRERWD